MRTIVLRPTPVYELGQFNDNRPYFSMKLVRGETLSKLLADRTDHSADRGRLMGIFEQVCQTMAYAHSRGVIHRARKTVPRTVSPRQRRTIPLAQVDSCAEMQLDRR